jgi:hypothetical protein
MTTIPPIPREYQRLIFAGLAFAGTVFFGILSVAVPSSASFAGDVAKIFAVGFIGFGSYYFGARGQT